MAIVGVQGAVTLFLRDERDGDVAVGVQVLPRRVTERGDGELVVERPHVEDLFHVLAVFVLEQDAVQQVHVARAVRFEIPQ